MDEPKVGPMRLGVVGGLGQMASPMARHWTRTGAARAIRVHDRGNPGRQQQREAWKQHGAALTGSLAELAGAGDLDGVVVCCGKNGDDLQIIGELANRLGVQEGRKFICHASTVGTSFVRAAAQYCHSMGVDYVNYPLTGGPIGAEKGTMLILASGPPELFTRLEATLKSLGTPRYFGERLTAAAEVKFIGHMMVFNGLMGVCSAAAAYAECFQGGQVGGPEQAAFFDFINGGAGGTRQWDLILSAGIRNDVWDSPFAARFGAVDAIYTADLCIETGLSRLTVDSLVRVCWAFSYLLNRIGEGLATHAIVREFVQQKAAQLDAFIDERFNSADSPREALERCVASLPDDVRNSVRLRVEAGDFAH